MNYFYKSLTTIFAVFILTFSLFCQEMGQDYIKVSGTVYSKMMKKPLNHVFVSVQNSSISVFTNNLGEYTLYIPFYVESDSICFVNYGYATAKYEIDKLPEQLDVYLEHMHREDLILFLPTNTEKYIKKAYASIKKNYSSEANEIEGMVKQIIKKDEDIERYTYGAFTAYGEGVNKKTQIKLIDIESYYDSSSLVHINSNAAIIFDYLQINFEKDFLRKDFLMYDFQIKAINYIDGRKMFKVDFKPNDHNIHDAKYSGYFYIDDATKAFVRFDYTKTYHNTTTSEFKHIRYDTVSRYEQKQSFIDSIISKPEDSIQQITKVGVWKDTLIHDLKSESYKTSITTIKENIKSEYKYYNEQWHPAYIYWSTVFKLNSDYNNRSHVCSSTSEIFINKQNDEPEGKYDAVDLLIKDKELHSQLDESHDIIWTDYNMIMPNKLELQLQNKLTYLQISEKEEEEDNDE